MRKAKQLHLLAAAEKTQLTIKQHRVNHTLIGENHNIQMNREFSHVTL